MASLNNNKVKLCERLQNDAHSRTYDADKSVFCEKERGYIPTNMSVMLIKGHDGSNFITEYVFAEPEWYNNHIGILNVSKDIKYTPNWKFCSALEELKAHYFKNEGCGIFIETLDVALALDLVQDYKLGCLLSKDQITDLKRQDPQFSDCRKFDFPRHIKTCNNRDAIRYGKSSLTFLKTEGKRYTFGVEIETVRGKIPSYISCDLNIQAVFDGSLRLEDGEAHGAEYVTGVLTGDAGLVHLQKIVSEISKRCMINKLCSVHVHVGGVDFNQEFIVYMYKLAQLLEKEIFAMMPKSRASSLYCQKIKPLDLTIDKETSYDISIKNNFEKIRNVINVVPVDECNYKISKKKDHPLGYHCKYDKGTPRYWWLNFLPAMYNIRKNETYTIEFRCHSGTMNYRKIENWILIVMGIVNFVENHKNKIKPGLKLSDVIKTTYPKNHTSLNTYIKMRQALFTSSNTIGSLMEQHEYETEENDNKKMTAKQIILSHE